MKFPISNITAIGALCLFFLPWINVRCSPGKTSALFPQNTPDFLIVQSGFQTITAGMKIKGETDFPGNGDSQDSKLENSVLTGLALGAVVIAVVFGLMGAPRVSQWICLGAVGVLGVQMAMGFPLEKMISEGQEGMSEFRSMIEGVPPSGDPVEMAQMSQMMGMLKPSAFESSKTMWFYLTLLLLGGTGAMAFFPSEDSSGRASPVIPGQTAQEAPVAPAIGSLSWGAAPGSGIAEEQPDASPGFVQAAPAPPGFAQAAPTVPSPAGFAPPTPPPAGIGQPQTGFQQQAPPQNQFQPIPAPAPAPAAAGIPRPVRTQSSSDEPPESAPALKLKEQAPPEMPNLWG